MPMNKKEDTIIATIICQDVFKETKSKSENKTAEGVKEREQIFTQANSRYHDRLTKWRSSPWFTSIRSQSSELT